jgi:hypothetical protein
MDGNAMNVCMSRRRRCRLRGRRRDLANNYFVAPFTNKLFSVDRCAMYKDKHVSLEAQSREYLQQGNFRQAEDILVKLQTR